MKSLRNMDDKIFKSYIINDNGLKALYVEGYQVSPCFQIFAVNILDNIWTCQTEYIIISLYDTWHTGEPHASEIFFHQSIRLNHRAHAAIQHQYSLFNYFLYSVHLSL